MTMNSEQDTLLALAESPHFKKDKLAFAGRQSGLYRSRDMGKTWDVVNIIAGESLSVTALAFARDGLVFAALPGGIAYSNDSGASWNWAQLAAPSPYVTALAVSPDFGKNKTLFAATLEDGVFRSVNGGEKWESWNFGLLDKQVLCLAVSRESVFAGTGTGLFRSDNNGRSWREMTLSIEDAILSLAVMGASLFVGTEKSGLLKSDDDGGTWKKVKAKGLGAPINQIQVSAGKEAFIRVAAGDTLHESVNKGKTWRVIHLATRDNPLILTA